MHSSRWIAHFTPRSCLCDVWFGVRRCSVVICVSEVLFWMLAVSVGRASPTKRVSWGILRTTTDFLFGGELWRPMKAVGGGGGASTPFALNAPFSAGRRGRRGESSSDNGTATLGQLTCHADTAQDSGSIDGRDGADEPTLAVAEPWLSQRPNQSRT